MKALLIVFGIFDVFFGFFGSILAQFWPISGYFRILAVFAPKMTQKIRKKIKISKIQNTSFISTPMDLFHVNFQQNWGKW